MGRKKIRSGGCILAGAVLFIAAALWGVFRLSGGNEIIDGSTNQMRIAFINQCGWETDVTHCELTEVRIPVNFDDVYEQYNRIQIMQGFDLRPYRAHSVKKYTYYIKNYYSDSVGVSVPDIYANLLVDDGRIIGADITSGEAGSFATVLKYDG